METKRELTLAVLYFLLLSVIDVVVWISAPTPYDLGRWDGIMIALAWLIPLMLALRGWWSFLMVPVLNISGVDKTLSLILQGRIFEIGTVLALTNLCGVLASTLIIVWLRGRK